MQLHHLKISKYTTNSGFELDIELSYQVFGQPLYSAPIILVNHALTGNSEVTGANGWWSDLIGDKKCIDTEKYTILAFNIPGNGYDGFIIENYKEFVAQDVANFFLQGLKQLKITKLFAIIGGSLGGGIAWEMVALNPNLAENLVPVASDWKSTDWLIANCQIQEQFLVNSKQPVHDARMHAMLCYRTPASFKTRFKRSTNDELQVFNVESWLMHHGKKLQERFQLSAYKLMNQLLKSIDITRDSGDAFLNIQKSNIKIHIISVDSDLFFTAEENKETYKRLAQASSNVTYSEIQSLHGHDAFLIEFEQLKQLLKGVFGSADKEERVKVLKFGGKSLANGDGLERVLNVVSKKIDNSEKLVLVVSAREHATDQLEEMLLKAKKGENYFSDVDAFGAYQKHIFAGVNISKEMKQIEHLLEGVSLVKDYSAKTKDELLSFGELISGKTVTCLLNEKGLKAELIDARNLIKTDDAFGNALVNESLSKQNVVERFKKLDDDVLPVVTGFIASNEEGVTTTLGRNGSNYTAALLANFLNAEELLNYTHVDGIFTADPSLVPDAKLIEELSYEEANELAYFGANILHAKTIIPLIEKNIPLRILNTFNEEAVGTIIGAKTSDEGIKSLSVLENMALVNIEGRGLMGKVGVDARIFNVLGRNQISVSIISQGSSERGVGFVVDADKAKKARRVLNDEFEFDFHSQDINNINVIGDVAIVSIVGQDLSTFHKPFNALITNGVVPLLFNNTVSGKNVSLVVNNNDLKKALNVIHNQVFEGDLKV